MSLFLPEGLTGDPWEAGERFLKQFDEEPSAVFKDTFRLKSIRLEWGLIVAHWGDEAQQLPTHYLHRRKFFGTVALTMASFAKFGDAKVVEDPCPYKTLTAMKRVIEISRKNFGPRFGLIFWTNPIPNYKFVPNAYHKALMGQQLAVTAKK